MTTAFVAAVLVIGLPALALGTALGPAGSTPKDISGILEMQVTIPPTTPSGAASINLTIGGVTTTQATTVFVQ